MFADYRTWVLSNYQKKRVNGELSRELGDPTPAKLRRECELAWTERFEKKDERILRSFFGALQEDESYGNRIRRFDPDKFRPLVKFMKEQIGGTEDKNIELLAWLLDLQPRPYQENHTYPTVTAETKKTPVDAGVEKRSDAKPQKKSARLERPVLLGTLLVMLFTVIGFGLYAVWPENTAAMSIGGPIPPPAKGGCMIWMNDHYEKLRCEDRAGQPGVLGIDSGRLAHFKRITDTLKINENSVGKVWYFKRKGQPEYYTAPGYHPIDTARWLKPLTKYMVDKYVLRKTIAAFQQ